MSELKCNDDCFNCPYPDCIADSRTIRKNESIKKSYNDPALTPEKQKQIDAHKRYYQEHKEEIKEYIREYQKKYYPEYYEKIRNGLENGIKKELKIIIKIIMMNC